MPKIDRRYNNRDSHKPDLKLCDRLFPSSQGAMSTTGYAYA
ncbi:hypothetical protein [Nostoc sp. KVJ3]|nr:hypothetical protein [Nostoc sp. KVJ3]